jgi:mRNA interferase MazF
MGLATSPERIRRGDVWLIDFGSMPSDPEQGFHRPAVVVSDDRLHHPNLNMLIVVPGTTTLRSLPLHVVVEPADENGLQHRTAFQVEQVRAVSTARLLERLGALSTESRYAIDEVLRSVLRL